MLMMKARLVAKFVKKTFQGYVEYIYIRAVVYMIDTALSKLVAMFPNYKIS